MDDLDSRSSTDPTDHSPSHYREEHRTARDGAVAYVLMAGALAGLAVLALSILYTASQPVPAPHWSELHHHWGGYRMAGPPPQTFSIPRPPAPAFSSLLLLAVIIGGVVIVLLLARSWPSDDSDDVKESANRLVKEHSQAGEWSGLIEIEQAASLPERRLLLAREFCRLSSEVLSLPPTDRKHWPNAKRLVALRRQAHVLLASATDQNAPELRETLPDDPLIDPSLVAAVRTLARYYDLLAALRDSPVEDLEVVRVLARERNRLGIADERVSDLLRAS